MGSDEQGQADGAAWENPRANATLRDQARATGAAISNAASLRGLALLVVGTIVMLTPGITTTLVQALVVGLIGFTGLMDLWYTVTGRRWFGRRISRWLTALRGLVSIAFALILGLIAYVAEDALSLRFVVALLGLYVAARGVLAIIVAVVKRRERSPAARVAGGAVAAAIGALAAVVPDAVSTVAIAGAAVGAIVIGLILLAWGLLRAARHSDLDPSDASVADILWDWIHLMDLGRKERAEQADTLYFEHPERFTKIATWWVMLALSVAIATFAVLADSTAVVIGAMLVAPLMTPIVGLAGALVNGWRRRAFQSAVMVVAGATVSIVIAYVIAEWTPVAITYSSNSQIVSRVNPTTIDMLIALAAGAAGAFATVNKRVSSGIAGVAIAVALVPPLAVVGVSLGAGRIGDATGALLLFLTNFVAIVIAASIVFVLTGFARPFALRQRSRQVALTMAPFIVLAGVILIPLTLTAEGVLANETRERAVSDAVTEWLGPESDFVVTAIAVDGGRITVTISGPGEPPSAQALADMLQEEAFQTVELTLQVAPLEVIEVEGRAG